MAAAGGAIRRPFSCAPRAQPLPPPGGTRTMAAMATIAIYSLKGGVGKTTLAVNLAWCAATLSSRRTLLWDLDPQAASTWLLGGAAPGDQARAIFTRDVPPAGRARATAIPRLDLIGADPSLRGLDQLFHDLDKRRRLNKLLAGLHDYQRVILDCPPGLTNTAEQVMRAADLIVVPVIPSPLSERAHHEVVRHLGGKVPVLAVHAMVDRRRARHVDALARRPDWPVVPMASAIEAMTTRRAPVGSYAANSAAGRSFAMLWQAIEQRLAG